MTKDEKLISEIEKVTWESECTSLEPSACDECMKLVKKIIKLVRVNDSKL